MIARQFTKQLEWSKVTEINSFYLYWLRIERPNYYFLFLDKFNLLRFSTAPYYIVADNFQWGCRRGAIPNFWNIKLLFHGARSNELSLAREEAADPPAAHNSIIFNPTNRRRGRVLLFTRRRRCMQSYCDLIKLLHAASGAALKKGQEKQLPLCAPLFSTFFPACCRFINPRAPAPNHKFAGYANFSFLHFSSLLCQRFARGACERLIIFFIYISFSRSLSPAVSFCCRNKCFRVRREWQRDEPTGPP